MPHDELSRAPSSVIETAGPRLDGMRARAEELRRQSQALRVRSAAALTRRDAALQKLEIRQELLRTEFEHLRVRLRNARAELAARESDLQEWLGVEVLEMIVSGWSRQELADVGIGRQLLRDLRLDDHPRLRPPG